MAPSIYSPVPLTWSTYVYSPQYIIRLFKYVLYLLIYKRKINFCACDTDISAQSTACSLHDENITCMQGNYIVPVSQFLVRKETLYLVSLFQKKFQNYPVTKWQNLSGNGYCRMSKFYRKLESGSGSSHIRGHSLAESVCVGAEEF